MKQIFEPSVDPWDLLVEHNQRIQRLEAHVGQLAQLVEQLTQQNLQNIKTANMNTQTITTLTRAHEENLRLVLDLAGKLNTAQGDHNGQTISDAKKH